MKDDMLNAVVGHGLAYRVLPAMAFIFLSVANVSMADTTPEELMLDDSNSERTEFLQGKRLFFDSHERATHQSTLDDTAVNRELAKPLTTSTGRDDDAGVGREPLKASSSKNRLRYEAYIRSADAISVIVNGGACVRLVHDARILVDTTEQKLDCPSLIDKNLTLLLLGNTKSLKVMHGTSLSGILMPGQSL